MSERYARRLMGLGTVDASLSCAVWKATGKKNICSYCSRSSMATSFARSKMAECDQRLQQYLQQQEDRSQGARLPDEKRKEPLTKKKRGIRHSSIEGYRRCSGAVMPSQ